MCPHPGDLVCACRKYKGWLSIALAEGDVVDTLGMPLEGGQHFVCSMVIKLDDLLSKPTFFSEFT